MNQFIDKSYPSKEDLTFFASNSEKLTNYLEVENIYTDLQLKEYNQSIYYTFKCSHLDGVSPQITFNTSIMKENYGLKKVTCKNDKNQTFTFIGYQCSENKKDQGYDYFYDILTSEIYYIGNTRESAFEVIIFNNIETGKNILTYKENNIITENETEEDVAIEDLSSYESLGLFITTKNCYSNSDYTIDLFDTESNTKIAKYDSNDLNEILPKLNNIIYIFLNLNETQPFDLEILTTLPNPEKIEKLFISNYGNCVLFSFDKLNYFYNLKTLDLSNCQLINIDFLIAFNELEYIDLRDNNITDYTILGSLPNLKKVDIDQEIKADDEQSDDLKR